MYKTKNKIDGCPTDFYAKKPKAGRPKIYKIAYGSSGKKSSLSFLPRQLIY